jgi:putative tryptophan/tyrosine transport system substrate-binding protein
MRRREFITLVVGAATGWPFAARAQQSAVRRVGVLMNYTEDDPEGAALRDRLGTLGWTDGRNVQIETRYG